MKTFEGKIILAGYGAIGRSLHSILEREIDINHDNFYVLDAKDDNIEEYIALGGKRENYIIETFDKDNYPEILSRHLNEGDLLIDLLANVGTGDMMAWCARNNVMYINSGDSCWPCGDWATIHSHFLDRTKKQYEISKIPGTKKFPILLHSGANPGAVSIFAKMAVRHAAQTQMADDKAAQKLSKESKWAELAQHMGIKMIQIADLDTQDAKIKDRCKDTLYNTWSPQTLFEESMTQTESIIGTHERLLPNYEFFCEKDRFLIHEKIAQEEKCRSWAPAGNFIGSVVPHDEINTISKLFTINSKKGTHEGFPHGRAIKKPCYCPTVIFVYRPSPIAYEYMNRARDERIEAPKKTKVMYEELTGIGTEYVGVMIFGEKINPVWVGNAVSLKDAQKFGMQNTPTILQVSSGVLAGIVWLMKHRDVGGIFYPEDVDMDEYNEIMEKYMGETIIEEVAREEINAPIQWDDIQYWQFQV